MSDAAESYILEIAWDREGLPARVGPFESRQEAEDWGHLNIPNGAWLVAPLAYPYLRPYLRIKQ